MNILGFACFHHNAAAALIRDGEIVAMAEEERFTRRKHEKRFPAGAIRYCLSEGDITPEELDHVAFYYKRFLGIPTRLCLVLTGIPRSLRLASEQGGEFFEILSARRRITKFLEELGGSAHFRFHFINHHIAHVCSTFYPSPFEKAAVLSVDGNGEIASTLTCLVEGNSVNRLVQVNFPHSIGHFYSAMTEYLGFRNNSGEGKVMGLAPYGEPVYADKLRNVLEPLPGGGFRLDMSYMNFHLSRTEWYTEKLVRYLGVQPRKREGAISADHENLAASVQLVTEEAALHVADHLQRETGEKRLCLAGGVALNSVMNTRIATELPFEKVSVQPAAHDAGTALGAALAVHHLELDLPRARSGSFDPFLGPSFGNDSIEKLLTESGSRFKLRNDPAAAAAELIAEGRIVGWFQGRMETGPRALGNRSILAHPGIENMKDILNGRVKHRESFRPFAPAVLEDQARECFDAPFDSPYMLFVFPVTESWRRKVPAITHVDGTGRVQTVSRKANPLFHRLLTEFYQRTGLPMVLNTSFNIRGEPIVCTPGDALSCFLGTGIDDLFLGPYHVSKDPEQTRTRTGG